MRSLASGQWWYHAGDTPPSRWAAGNYIHLGTIEAALQILGWTHGRTIWKIRLSPKAPLRFNFPSEPLSDFEANTLDWWLEEGRYRHRSPEGVLYDYLKIGEPIEVGDLIDSTEWTPRTDAIYYENNIEDPGSISVMVQPSAIDHFEVITIDEAKQIAKPWVLASVTSDAVDHLRDQWRSLRLRRESSEAGLRFTTDTTGYSHGQTDSSILAWRGDDFLGVLSYSEFEGEFHINVIDVLPEHQRQGVATFLFAVLKGLASGRPIHTGLFTSDGTEWWASVPDAMKNNVVAKVGSYTDYYEIETALLGRDRTSWEFIQSGPGATVAAERLLRRILVAEGVPRGDSAFITVHPNPGTSAMAWDLFEDVPGAALGSRMMNPETVIHEAAHIIVSGRPARPRKDRGAVEMWNDRNAAHDQRWKFTYMRLLREYGGEQGQELANRLASKRVPA